MCGDGCARNIWEIRRGVGLEDMKYGDMVIYNGMKKSIVYIGNDEIRTIAQDFTQPRFMKEFDLIERITFCYDENENTFYPISTSHVFNTSPNHNKLKMVLSELGK